MRLSDTVNAIIGSGAYLMVNASKHIRGNGYHALEFIRQSMGNYFNVIEATFFASAALGESDFESMAKVGAVVTSGLLGYELLQYSGVLQNIDFIQNEVISPDGFCQTDIPAYLLGYLTCLGVSHLLSKRPR